MSRIIVNGDNDFKGEVMLSNYYYLRHITLSIISIKSESGTFKGIEKLSPSSLKDLCVTPYILLDLTKPKG